MEEEQNDRIPETEAVTKLRQVIENLENYLRQKHGIDGSLSVT